MDAKTILKLAKEGKTKTDKLLLDPRYKRVLGFFVAKKLLVAEKIKPLPNIKLNIRDVIWVAENLEPRIWEVLPAAIIHFPKTFFNQQYLPENFSSLIESIKRQKDIKEIFKGVSFNRMRYWAEIPLLDQRVKPIGIRKATKTFRLSPLSIQIINQGSKELKITKTEFLEKIILKEKK